MANIMTSMPDWDTDEEDLKVAAQEQEEIDRHRESSSDDDGSRNVSKDYSSDTDEISFDEDSGSDSKHSSKHSSPDKRDSDNDSDENETKPNARVAQPKSPSPKTPSPSALKSAAATRSAGSNERRVSFNVQVTDLQSPHRTQKLRGGDTSPRQVMGAGVRLPSPPAVLSPSPPLVKDAADRAKLPKVTFSIPHETIPPPKEDVLRQTQPSSEAKSLRVSVPSSGAPARIMPHVMMSESARLHQSSMLTEQREIILQLENQVNALQKAQLQRMREKMDDIKKDEQIMQLQAQVLAMERARRHDNAVRDEYQRRFEREWGLREDARVEQRIRTMLDSRSGFGGGDGDVRRTRAGEKEEDKGGRGRGTRDSDSLWARGLTPEGVKLTNRLGKELCDDNASSGEPCDETLRRIYNSEAFASLAQGEKNRWILALKRARDADLLEILMRAVSGSGAGDAKASRRVAGDVGSSGNVFVNVASLQSLLVLQTGLSSERVNAALRETVEEMLASADVAHLVTKAAVRKLKNRR